MDLYMFDIIVFKIFVVVNILFFLNKYYYRIKGMDKISI